MEKSCSQMKLTLAKVLARKFFLLCLALCLLLLSAGNLSKQFEPRSSQTFCCQLIIFANSLDPDQARQNVGPADKMSGLIWIQNVLHPDGIKKIQHPKSKIWHNNNV